MYDLKSVQPVRAVNKVRLGRSHDGGYVLLREQVAMTRVLLSFGVATDWSFERAFAAANPDAKILMFDRSTWIVRIAATAVKKALWGDMAKARHYRDAALDYRRFFLVERKAVLTRKFLGLTTGPTTVTFDEIMAPLISGGLSPKSVFVKLDIEGMEYDLLPVITHYAEYLNGLAIEFHDLGTKGNRLMELAAAMAPRLRIVHLHGNNYAPLIPGTALPESLEMSVAHSDLLSQPALPDPGPFPAAGLDFPNDPSRIDYPLDFP